MKKNELGVIWYHLKWAWRTRQPRYVIGIIKAVIKPGIYYTWWNIELAAHRRRQEIEQRLIKQNV